MNEIPHSFWVFNPSIGIARNCLPSIAENWVHNYSQRVKHSEATRRKQSKHRVRQMISNSQSVWNPLRRSGALLRYICLIPETAPTRWRRHPEASCADIEIAAGHHRTGDAVLKDCRYTGLVSYRSMKKVSSSRSGYEKREIERGKRPKGALKK